MLQGTCPECGTRYYGWALREPEHQTCGECGAKLIISEGSVPRKVSASESSKKDPWAFLKDIV